MRRCRKQVLLAALVALAAGLLLQGCTESEGINPTASELSAQTMPSDRGAIWQELGLTDAQREQLVALRAEHREKMRALRAGFDETVSREDRQAARRALRDDMHAELATLLSTEQLTKLEQWRTERRAGGGKHGWRGHAINSEAHAKRMQRRLEYLTEALKLTTEQQEQLRAAFEAVIPAKGLSRHGRRQMREDRRAAFESQLKAILTDTQFEQFLGIRAERGAGKRFGRSSD